MDDSLKAFIQAVPKAELHLHIEGTLEPELMFEIAERNQIKLPYGSVKEIRNAYQFENLQSFLDLYYQGCNVLQNEDDFYDLTWEYLEKAVADNVKHVEFFFDPQTHTDRGIPFDVMFEGMHQAAQDAKNDLGIHSEMIMCFLRHLSEEAAFETLKQAEPYKDKIIAVGLDSSEVGHPPEKFQRVFQEALKQGYKTVAHAGEEGSPDYIWQAIELLNVSRIDHGVRCIEDDDLVDLLVERQTPLTVCPLSNVKLCVYKNIQEHNIKKLLDKGLCVMVNSDDPAYFGGYVNQNYLAIAEGLNLNIQDIKKLAINSFTSSFISEDAKLKFIKQIESMS